MLQTGRVVVEIAPPSTVVSAEAPLPSTMPPIGMTQVLADVIAVADPDSGAFGFPRLRVAVRSTDASRLAVFLALPDGSAAVLPFQAAGDGGTFEIVVPEPGTRIIVLEFATADDAAVFARAFELSGVPGPGFEGVPGPGFEAGQGPGFQGAQLWDWDDEDLEGWDDAALPDERFAAAARVPELHVVGGQASRRPQPAARGPERAAPASSSTSATVLPWPSSRRPGTVDDPDLPGGA